MTDNAKHTVKNASLEGAENPVDAVKKAEEAVAREGTEGDRPEEVSASADVEDDGDRDLRTIEDEQAGQDEPALSEVEQLILERDDYKDKFMRTLAEVENVRKRFERARQDAEKYGGSRIIRDMLPVYDNLNRALGSAAEEKSEVVSSLIEGVELTLKELKKVFENHGIEIIRPEVGDKFDPTLHEAMFEAPVPGTKAGEIIEVSVSGFQLHDRLLRPAQVGVSSTTN